MACRINAYYIRIYIKALWYLDSKELSIFQSRLCEIEPEGKSNTINRFYIVKNIRFF